MLEEDAEGRVQPAERVDNSRRDEVVPAREAEVAMEEEEHSKHERCDEVAELEPLVAPVPQRREGGEGQVCLCDNGHDASPVKTRRIPFLHHVALPDVEDDEGECVDQCEDEHGVADPAMEDLESFVADARHGSDHVGFGRGCEDEWQTGQGHPSRPGREWWRVAEGNRRVFAVRPVVRSRTQAHGKEEDCADCA